MNDTIEVWPISQAANACFGTEQRPSERPVPQVSIEFDVADAAAVVPAAQELEQADYELLHGPRLEPWGQTVARLQSSENAIVGISCHLPKCKSSRHPGGRLRCVRDG